MRHASGAVYVENLLDDEQEGLALSGADRALLQELVCGVVRWQATLDWLIARKTGGRKQKLILQVLLRLGLYQIFWLDRIPDHAITNETVQMAKQSGCGPQAGFINAVLRNCLRERDTIKSALSDLKATQPALGYSHPEWLCQRWQRQWGDDQLRLLLDWNNTPPVTYARVNTLRVKIEALRELWASERVEVKLRHFNGAGDLLIYELLAHPPLARLASFKRGMFYVQDPSTLLAVRELHPQPGETILDFCAAPGGKTSLIAQLMENRGRIVAHDVTADRLSMVTQNCARLGASCVQTVLPEDLEAWPRPPQFDRILVDAPCSNTGVLRRRLDLRWRLRLEEIRRLRDTQGEILKKAASWLKPGGVLVYSTCSLEPEENGGVVHAFLESHRDFQLQRDRLLLPFADGVDGAYAARFVRVKSG